MAIFAFGLLFGYLACLHGTEMDQNDLIAFGAWSGVAVTLGFVATFFFKYVVMLLVLALGALWYTENPVVAETAGDARWARGEMCKLITIEIPDVPYKQYIC